MGPLSSDNHQRTHCTTPELFIDHHCKTQMRFLVIPPVNRSTGSNLMVNVCPAAGFNRATHKLVAINKARFWYFKAFLLLNGKYSVSFFYLWMKGPSIYFDISYSLHTFHPFQLLLSSHNATGMIFYACLTLNQLDFTFFWAL